MSSSGWSHPASNGQTTWVIREIRGCFLCTFSHSCLGAESQANQDGLLNF